MTILTRLYVLTMLLLLPARYAAAQQAYFIDGYHGGIYGHYPVWNTRFMADQLLANPYWKINLEIEPVTWDDARLKDPEAYEAFRSLFADQSANGRIEYVNPSYAQSYLYNISGESIIRQFAYGIKKVKEHFPTAVFTTYSSEEPCFTSALPQVLRSFGFKYASLKNPNTCWGGYTRAFGGELVNWMGPDGTALPTVPRYAIEALEPGSAWQTIAWANSRTYLDAAFKAGIAHPIGMCLQDAGWKNGPWLKKAVYNGKPVLYETWRHYFENVAARQPSTNWRLSQEDIQVSLVWGAQVLQRLARQVRSAENKLVATEKLAAIAGLYNGFPWPATALDSAWKSLLLAQHHDCWIVPYNGNPGDTWADKVALWTQHTETLCDSITAQAVRNGAPAANDQDRYIRVFNTTGMERAAWVKVNLPANWSAPDATVLDSRQRRVPAQLLKSEEGAALLLKATVPPLGYATYLLKKAAGSPAMQGATVSAQPNGQYAIETDLYHIVLDPARGGVISSLFVKAQRRELVDKKNERGFNEIRGYFYEEGVFHSSMDSAATIIILENSPARVQLRVVGHIGAHPFSQLITVAQGQRRIDFQLRINWQGNPGIGEFSQAVGFKWDDPRKAFYNDRFKLQALFPVDMPAQRISKDAPFDVTDSRLTNTFFNTWDSIKNNIILHWVDVTDGGNTRGLAMFTDHTSSYVHGENYPPGLTLQYAGKALWGRDYDITGPTEMNYALAPHTGNWATGGVWQENIAWCEPLQGVVMEQAPGAAVRSLLSVNAAGWEVTTLLRDGKDLLVRIFNAAGSEQKGAVRFDGRADSIMLAELDGRTVRELPLQRRRDNSTVAKLSIPRFGIRTLRLVNAAAPTFK